MSANPHPACILIVEDNYLIAEEVGDLVRSFGYSVAGAAPSVAQGLAILDSQRVDGAVLDLDLGGNTSLPLCRALQARGVPFIFLSRYGRGTMVPTEFHATLHLDKPVDRRKLQSAVDSLFGPDSVSPLLGNQVIDGLPAEQRRVIAHHLHEVTLKKGDVLETKGHEVSRVYFPIDALISIFAGNSRGQGIEAASIGSNGMTAPSVLLDDAIALGDTVVQMAGRAHWLPVTVLRHLTERDPHLRRYLLCRISSALRDIMDTSLSTGRFTITERLARWLVHATHRVGSQRLIITHSTLAEILAVRRPSVTLGLQTIEGYGLIRSTRRVVLVRDLEGLTDLARLKSSSSS